MTMLTIILWYCLPLLRLKQQRVDQGIATSVLVYSTMVHREGTGASLQRSMSVHQQPLDWKHIHSRVILWTISKRKSIIYITIEENVTKKDINMDLRGKRKIFDNQNVWHAGENALKIFNLNIQLFTGVNPWKRMIDECDTCCTFVV